jgi:hypothetical protein
LEELISDAELLAISFLEVSGRRKEARDGDLSDTAGEGSGSKLRVWRRADGGQIEVRCRIEVGSTEASFVADAVAVFGVEALGELDAATEQEFTERVGIMVIYPYLREAVHQSAQRLAVDTPLLSLITPVRLRSRHVGEESTSPD